MDNCPTCGCVKPCACDMYTPDSQDTCICCGCTKPCPCDGYSGKEKNVMNESNLTEKIEEDICENIDEIIACSMFERDVKWENFPFKLENMADPACWFLTLSPELLTPDMQFPVLEQLTEDLNSIHKQGDK